MWSWCPPFSNWRGSRGFVSLLCDTTRGRCPCSLISPCQGACPGPRLSLVLLDSLHHGHKRGLLLGLPLGGLLGGIFNGNRRLGCSLAGNVARINIRCRTSKRRHHSDAKSRKKTRRKEVQKTSCGTYRSELLCVAAKNLLLVLPVAAAASAPPSHVSSVCGAGGSLVTRQASIGTTSGRLRGLRTKDGAASSSSSSSSVILTSRRHFGASLVSADNASFRDGSTAIGLFPATLSSVVGTGPFCSSSLLVY